MRAIKNGLILLLLGFILAPAHGLAQKIPESAQRHMVRGKTAIEMAKSNDDLEGAKKELKKAIEYAPRWPRPHYELALVQEKTGQFKEAATSLRNYLRLFPKAPNAAKLREHIYKLEYQAERMLATADIIDVLTSGFSLSGDWENVSRQPSAFGSAIKREGGCRAIWMELHFKRAGGEHVQVLQSEMYYQPVSSRYQNLKITGPVVKYVTMVNVCGVARRACDSVMQNEVEVVSRNQVQVRQTVLSGGEGAGVADGDAFVCTYRRKAAKP